MAMPTCPVKTSSTKPLQDLGPAFAASHNMKLRLSFRLAYHHIWFKVAYSCFLLETSLSRTPNTVQYNVREEPF